MYGNTSLDGLAQKPPGQQPNLIDRDEFTKSDRETCQEFIADLRQFLESHLAAGYDVNAQLELFGQTDKVIITVYIGGPDGELFQVTVPPEPALTYDHTEENDCENLQQLSRQLVAQAISQTASFMREGGENHATAS